MDSNASSIPQEKFDKMQKLAGEASTSRIDLSMDASPVSPYSPEGGAGDVEKWELSEDEETGQVHVSTKKQQIKKSTASSMAEEIVSWKQWFKLPAFYIYGFVYMACRLLVNVQSVLFSLNFVLYLLVSDYLLSTKCFGNCIRSRYLFKRTSYSVCYHPNDSLSIFNYYIKLFKTYIRQDWQEEDLQFGSSLCNCWCYNHDGKVSLELTNNLLVFGLKLTESDVPNCSFTWYRSVNLSEHWNCSYCKLGFDNH